MIRLAQPPRYFFGQAQKHKLRASTQKQRPFIQANQSSLAIFNDSDCLNSIEIMHLPWILERMPSSGSFVTWSRSGHRVCLMKLHHHVCTTEPLVLPPKREAPCLHCQSTDESMALEWLQPRGCRFKWLSNIALPCSAAASVMWYGTAACGTVGAYQRLCIYPGILERMLSRLLGRAKWKGASLEAASLHRVQYPMGLVHRVALMAAAMWHADSNGSVHRVSCSAAASVTRP